MPAQHLGLSDASMDSDLFQGAKGFQESTQEFDLFFKPATLLLYHKG